MKTVRHRYRDKRIFQTRTLTFEPYPMTETESVMGSIANNLTPEMVTKNIVRRMRPTLCLVTVSFFVTLFHLMALMSLSREGNDYHDCSHWWLVDTTTDKVYDITVDQYYHVNKLHYVDGKKKPCI